MICDRLESQTGIRQTWSTGLGVSCDNHNKWQPTKREPAKTKAELREMLTEAVRNSQAENKRLQQAKKRSRQKGRLTHI
jgi:hypothetical protein